MANLMFGKKDKEGASAKEERFEIQLELFKPGAKTYPQFDFRKECKKQLGSTAKSLYDFEGTSGISYSTELEIVKRLEKKYGKKNVKNKVIPWINDRVVDKGAGYEKDDFIDDSEDYDEMVPSSVDTARGGFYVNRGKLEWKDRDVLQMSEESSSSDSESGEDGEGIDDDELKELKNDAGDDVSKQLGKRKPRKSTANPESSSPTAASSSAGAQPQAQQKELNNADIQIIIPNAKQQPPAAPKAASAPQKRPNSAASGGAADTTDANQQRRLVGAPPTKKFATSGSQNQKMANDIKKKAMKSATATATTSAAVLAKKHVTQPSPGKPATNPLAASMQSQQQSLALALASIITSGSMPASASSTRAPASLQQTPPRPTAGSSSSSVQALSMNSSPVSSLSQFNSSPQKKPKGLPPFSQQLTNLISGFESNTRNMGAKKKLNSSQLDLVIGILDQAVSDGFSQHEKSRLLNQISEYCGYQKNTLYLKVQNRRSENSKNPDASANKQSSQSTDDDVQIVGTVNKSVSSQSQPIAPLSTSSTPPATNAINPAVPPEVKQMMNTILSADGYNLFNQYCPNWTENQKKDGQKMFAVAIQKNPTSGKRIHDRIVDKKPLDHAEYLRMIAEAIGQKPATSTAPSTSSKPAAGPSKATITPQIQKSAVLASPSSNSPHAKTLSLVLDSVNENLIFIEINKEVTNILANNERNFEAKKAIQQAVGGSGPKKPPFAISDKLSCLIQALAFVHWNKIKPRYNDEAKRREEMIKHVNFNLYPKLSQHVSLGRVWAEIGSSFDELRQILISPDIKIQIEKDKVDLAEILKRSLSQKTTDKDSVIRTIGQLANMSNNSSKQSSSATPRLSSTTPSSLPSSSPLSSRTAQSQQPQSSQQRQNPTSSTAASSSSASATALSAQQLKQAQDAMLQLIAGSMMAQTGSVPTTAAEHINQSQVEVMKKFQEEALRLQAVDRAKIQAAKLEEERKRKEAEEKRIEKEKEKEREREREREEARKKKEAERLEKLRKKEEEKQRKEKEKQEQLEAARKQKEELERKAAAEKAKIMEEERKRKEAEEERLRIIRIKQEIAEEASTRISMQGNMGSAANSPHPSPCSSSKGRRDSQQSSQRIPKVERNVSMDEGTGRNTGQLQGTFNSPNTSTQPNWGSSYNSPTKSMGNITSPVHSNVPGSPLFQQQQAKPMGTIPRSPIQNQSSNQSQTQSSPMTPPIFNGPVQQLFHQSSPQNIPKQSPMTTTRNMPNSSPVNQYQNQQQLQQQQTQNQQQHFHASYQQSSQIPTSPVFQNQNVPTSPNFMNQSPPGRVPVNQMSQRNSRQNMQSAQMQMQQNNFIQQQNQQLIHQQQQQQMMQRQAALQREQALRAQQQEQERIQQLQLQQQQQQQQQMIRAQQEQERLQQMQAQQQRNAIIQQQQQQQQQFAQQMQNNMGMQQTAAYNMFGGGMQQMQPGQQPLQHRPNFNNPGPGQLSHQNHPQHHQRHF